MINKKIAVFLNDYTEKKSGGVATILEIIRHSPEKNIIVLTSKMGQQLLRQEKIKNRCLITTDENGIENVFLLYLKRLIKIFFVIPKLKNKDIFLASSDFFPNTIPIWVIKLFSPEKIWVQHIFHLIPKNRKVSFWSQRLSLKLIKNRADLIIVDNNLLKKELIKKGFLPVKIVVNHLGVNHQHFEKIKSTRIKYQGIFLGRLHQAKGVFDLIKIWQGVVGKIHQAKLIIVGHGPRLLVEKIQKDINQKGLGNNIVFTGHLNSQQAFRKLAQSLVLVFPSHEEGFGLAPIEAQACSKPVVAWNLPVFKEVFPKGMIRVPIGKNRLFAKQVINLLQNKEYYQKIARQAKENSLKYSWQRTAQREWQTIEKIIN